jgi:amino acid permease
MVTYLPISSPFIRFASRYVDEAFGVAAGYNFFLLEALTVPFEIVACTFILGYWSDAVPAVGVIAVMVVLYTYVSFPLFLGTYFQAMDVNFLIDLYQPHQCLCRTVVWRNGVLASTR